jgi:maleylpyruvate isomerase
MARVAGAQRRFEAAVSGLRDADVRRPSLLPGWTVAHVLAHVARNADSHARRADGAVRGEVVEQYVGGVDGRQREIDASAAAPADALVADVADSAARLEAAWRRVPDDAWDGTTRDVGGRERPLRDLPARRWQELEVHVVDLGLGVTYEDWPDDFVAVWLPRLRAGLPSRLPQGTRAPSLDGLSEREELAWLYGRLTVARLPALAPWS